MAVSRTGAGQEVFSQSQGIFELGSYDNAPSILKLQISQSSPNLPTVTKISGMLSADQMPEARLAQFDPELYDLRDTSHLSRFMRALLGDAGAGQLRKRYTVARMETILSGTHFYDLDKFYGSIFSVRRRPEEMLASDPKVVTQTQDDWDEISVRDTAFRSRIESLAKALPMAGTVEGLRMAAEALLGCECEVYESWRLLASGGPSYSGNTWSTVQATYPTWSDTEDQTWNSLAGIASFGPTGLNLPNEILIRPLRTYAPDSDSADVTRSVYSQQAMDTEDVTRVLNKLKPAGTLVTVDVGGVRTRSQVPISSISSDSNYWETYQKVQPPPSTTDVRAIYGKAGEAASRLGKPVSLPVPQYSGSQGTAWYYNSSISTTGGLLIDESMDLETGNGGTVISQQEWEVRQPRFAGDTTTEWLPSYGIRDPGTVAAASAVNDAVMNSGSYALVGNGIVRGNRND